MLRHYTPAEGSHRAEHLLKFCLICPADARIVGQLQREVATLGDPRNAPCPAWGALSLSLYHLRGGEWEEALKSCEMGLASPERKSSCEASLQAVVAMAQAGMGKAELAEASLLKSRNLATICNGKDFERGAAIRPYWFDWAIANLLIKEAGAKIQVTPR